MMRIDVTGMIFNVNFQCLKQFAVLITGSLKSGMNCIGHWLFAVSIFLLIHYYLQSFFWLFTITADLCLSQTFPLGKHLERWIQIFQQELYFPRLLGMLAQTTATFLFPVIEEDSWATLSDIIMFILMSTIYKDLISL